MPGPPHVGGFPPRRARFFQKKKWLSAPAPAPPETQTPTKPDAESGSSIGEENPPPEIIWCDECAFRETAAEKKAELEALGIRPP